MPNSWGEPLETIDAIGSYINYITDIMGVTGIVKRGATMRWQRVPQPPSPSPEFLELNPLCDEVWISHCVHRLVRNARRKSDPSMHQVLHGSSLVRSQTTPAL